MPGITSLSCSKDTVFYLACRKIISQ